MHNLQADLAQALPKARGKSQGGTSAARPVTGLDCQVHAKLGRGVILSISSLTHSFYIEYHRPEPISAPRDYGVRLLQTRHLAARCDYENVVTNVSPSPFAKPLRRLTDVCDDKFLSVPK